MISGQEEDDDDENGNNNEVQGDATEDEYGESIQQISVIFIWE